MPCSLQVPQGRDTAPCVSPGRLGQAGTPRPQTRPGFSSCSRHSGTPRGQRADSPSLLRAANCSFCYSWLGESPTARLGSRRCCRSLQRSAASRGGNTRPKQPQSSAALHTPTPVSQQCHFPFSPNFNPWNPAVDPRDQQTLHPLPRFVVLASPSPAAHIHPDRGAVICSGIGAKFYKVWRKKPTKPQLRGSRGIPHPGTAATPLGAKLPKMNTQGGDGDTNPL